MNYKTDDCIKFENKYHECIISNKEMAVFAPLVKHRKGGRKLYYKNLIVLSNFKEDFKYEKIKLHLK